MASANLSPTSDSSPNNSFADRNIPQWKKELIQRRKNLAKVTNAANLTMSPPPQTGKVIGSPTKLVKDLATATSPTHTPITSPTTGKAGPQTIITTPPTPTRHSIPFVGHSLHSTTTSSISTAAAAAKSSETSLLLKQQQQQLAHTNKPMFAPTNEVEKPLHSQSHSNDGGVNNNCGANNASATSKIAIINKNPTSPTTKKPSTVSVASKDCGDGAANKVLTKCGVDSGNGKLTKFEQSPKAASDGKCEKKKHIEFAINDKMVAADDDVQTMADDGTEELTYGPGIVSKLRCRYLSLALRQSKASRQRPSLNNMRRATSLNNLLDDDEEDDSVLSDEEDDLEKEKEGHKENGCHRRTVGHTNGNFLTVEADEEEGSEDNRNGGGFFQKNRNRTNEKNDYNRYKRGNDLSMKRARSVETLLRYENKQWNKSAVSDGQDKEIVATDDDHIESRIINAREHGVAKPKRLTAYIDDDERPPPDVVKQTLKIFEATNNRRSRTANRKIGSEVAAKVATFKSIISLEKPLIAHAKPPLSPKKPNVKPRTTAPPEPTVAAVKAYSPNNTVVAAPAVANFDNKLSKFNKEKPVLPKLDINIIKNNLESANHNNSSNNNNNINNNIKCNYQENNNVLLSNKKQQQRTPSPVTVRCDFQTYRNNNNNASNISRGETPLSPLSRSESCSPNPVLITTPNRGPPPPPPNQQQTPIRSDSPRKFYASLLTNSQFESPFSNLSEKMNNFNLNETSTPKAAVKASPIGPPPLPPPRTISAAAAVANHNLMNKLSPTLNTVISPDPKTNNKPPKKDNLNVQTPARPVDSSSSDFDDDFEESDDHIKRISRTALDNIAKAGLTTEFKFNNTKNNSNLCDNKNAKNQMLNEKSYLPNGASARTTPTPPVVKKDAPLNNDTHISKQVGVVKPSLYEPEPGKNEFSYNFLDNDDATSRHSPASSTSSSSSSSFIENGGDVVCAKPVRVSDSNGHSATSDSVEIGHVINNAGGQQQSPTTNKDSLSNSFSEKPVLTSREIEKNLLNKEKSAVEPTTTTTTPSVVDSVTAATNSVVVGVAVAVAAPSPIAATNNSVSSAVNSNVNKVNNKKKSWQQPEENNTMVFNFSNRTDVPDYIENAGIMIRRKKELPKPGESGFVLLGDLTLETSTDDLEEDAWTLGPPSPCTVEFPDGGVIINGKSSLRSKPKEAKLKIQFDDSLTATFEYPSESSLLEDDPADRSLHGDGIMSNTKLLTSMPLGTNPFASYTPVKASIATHFELGVTRVSPPPTANGQSNNSTTNNSSSSSNNSSLSNNNYHINGTTTATLSSTTLASAGLVTTAAGVATNTNGQNISMEETDSLQYLKPATDDQTVVWSEGTRATDLLF